MQIAAVLLYLLLIAYGSLYPFTGWRVPLQGGWQEIWTFLFASWPRYVTRTDLITNVLAYIPFGYLLTVWLRAYANRWPTVFYAALGGALCSLAMESLQVFLPGRIASNLDILTNIVGTLIGVALYRFLQNGKWPGHLLPLWRGQRFVPGLWGDVGLLLLALWALSQLSLDMPSLVAGNLKTQFIPVWELAGNWRRLHPLHALIYGLESAVATLYIACLLRRWPRSLLLWMSLFAFVWLCKLLAAALLLKGWVLPRLLSGEVLIGIVLAGLFIVWARHVPRGPRTHALVVLLAVAVALQWWLLRDTVAPLSDSGARTVVPLNITALAGWIALIWPFLVALFLAPPLLPSPALLHAKEDTESTRSGR